MTDAELRKDPKAHHPQLLGQKLSGVINADVNGGIKKIEEAFLTDEYAQSSPDDVPYIEDIKSELKLQMKILEPLLQVKL